MIQNPKSSRSDDHVEDVEELKEIQAEATFTVEHEFIAEGAHAFIFKVIAIKKRNEAKTLCLKIFKKGWMTPFNLEKRAYAILRAEKSRSISPKYTAGENAVPPAGDSETSEETQRMSITVS